MPSVGVQCVFVHTCTVHETVHGFQRLFSTLCFQRFSDVWEILQYYAEPFVFCKLLKTHMSTMVGMSGMAGMTVHVHLYGKHLETVSRTS